MITVIQCAASKRPGAGHLRSPGGEPIIFVADPKVAPPDATHQYARPDDPFGTGLSWRQVLVNYNAAAKGNPLHLCPAYQLYNNKTYERLVDCRGAQNVYILSAGWGLIRADFLTPFYNITFTQSAESYMRRRKTDRYADFRMLPDDTEEDVLFFGGKDYLPLFCALTDRIRGRRTVFYNSVRIPNVPGCVLQRFATTTRTNWHYECANAFLDGAARVL